MRRTIVLFVLAMFVSNICFAGSLLMEYYDIREAQMPTPISLEKINRIESECPHLNIIYDDMDDTYSIVSKDKYKPQIMSGIVSLHPVIIVRNGQYSIFKLAVRSSSLRTLNWSSILIKADENRYEARCALNRKQLDVEYVDKFIELYWFAFRGEELEAMQKIANSRDSRIRLVSQAHPVDKQLTSLDKTILKEVLNAYNILNDK